MTNEQWGNLELPGLSDDKLLNTNWNQVTAARERSSRPEWQKANNEHNINQQDKSWVRDAKENDDPAYLDWKKVHDEGCAKNPDNPVWLAGVGNANRARNSKPEFIDQVKAGLAKYVEENADVIKARNNISNTNPDHIANRKEGMKEFWDDPEASKAARLARSKANSKPIQTPIGIFPSVTIAALEYNKIKNFKNGRKWVMAQMKKYPNEFYFITKKL